MTTDGRVLFLQRTNPLLHHITATIRLNLNLHQTTRTRTTTNRYHAPGTRDSGWTMYQLDRGSQSSRWKQCIRNLLISAIVTPCYGHLSQRITNPFSLKSEQVSGWPSHVVIVSKANQTQWVSVSHRSQPATSYRHIDAEADSQFHENSNMR